MFSYINIVASPQMKELLLRRNKKARVFLGDITPVDNSQLKTATDKITFSTLEKLKKFEKIILYIIPRNEGGSKGYAFVKFLLEKLPNNILLLAVGTTLDEIHNLPNVININRIPSSNLYYLYKKANLTIVPSIYTEGFGRVVIESLINETPVIVSPQCGANYLFKNKKYLKIIPLNVNLWVKEIINMLEHQINIPNEDLKWLEQKFSPEKCAETILKFLKK